VTLRAEPDGGIVREIGASQARKQFGQLLNWIAAGEHVVVTRRGKVVARLVPPGAPADRERGRRAADRIRESRKGVTLGGTSLKELIGEGRL
jgi:prevent-host-death family protein